MRGIIITTAIILAACSDKAPEPSASQETNQPVAATAEVAPADDPVEVASAETVPGVEPTDEFYDACIVGSFPGSNSLVYVTNVRVGDFVGPLASDGEGDGWEAAGDKRFVFRSSRTNQLTNEAESLALMLRQVNAPPRDPDLVCGPRSVVLEGAAHNGVEMTPAELYAFTKQSAANFAEAAANGPPRAYSEPASTENDQPYTERVINELGAANAARRAGL